MTGLHSFTLCPPKGHTDGLRWALVGDIPFSWINCRFWIVSRLAFMLRFGGRPWSTSVRLGEGNSFPWLGLLSCPCSTQGVPGGVGSPGRDGSPGQRVRTGPRLVGSTVGSSPSHLLLPAGFYAKKPIKPDGFLFFSLLSIYSLSILHLFPFTYIFYVCDFHQNLGTSIKPSQISNTSFWRFP